MTVVLDDIAEATAQKLRQTAENRRYNRLAQIDNWQIIRPKIFHKCEISGQWILPLAECYYGSAMIWLDDIPLYASGQTRDYLTIIKFSAFVTKEALTFARLRGLIK